MIRLIALLMALPLASCGGPSEDGLMRAAEEMEAAMVACSRDVRDAGQHILESQNCAAFPEYRQAYLDEVGKLGGSDRGPITAKAWLGEREDADVPCSNRCLEAQVLAMWASENFMRIAMESYLGDNEIPNALYQPEMWDQLREETRLASSSKGRNTRDD